MAMDLASGKTREIAPRWDASADGITLSADGKWIYTTAQELGRHPLFRVSLANGEVERVVEGRQRVELRPSPGRRWRSRATRCRAAT